MSFDPNGARNDFEVTHPLWPAQPLPAYNAAVPPPAAAPASNLPAGVAQLFDPNFGRTETLTRGAENALAGGYGGSGFGANQSVRLLDSERKANFLAGHQILEPYLQRQHQSSENAADRASRLQQIAAEGQQAMERLRMSEAGQTARLSSELSARLQQQVLDGQQAMQRLTLTEAGATSRQNTGIRGDLAQIILQSALRRPDTTATTTPGSGVYTHYADGIRLGDYADTPATTTRGSSGLLGASSVDAILRRYGLTF